MSEIAIAVFAIVLAAMYMQPYLIAKWQHHRDAEKILALNLFLGWTVIGWFAAFTWTLLSMSTDRHTGRMQLPSA